MCYKLLIIYIAYSSVNLLINKWSMAGTKSTNSYSVNVYSVYGITIRVLLFSIVIGFIYFTSIKWTILTNL